MAINKEVSNTDGLFSSYEFLHEAANNLERRLLITITPEERHILSANRPLAHALFGDNSIAPFLADGSTTIGGLNLKPVVLYDVLRHPDIRRAIGSGALTLRDLMQLSADRLSSAKAMLSEEAYNPEALAETLQLSGKAADRFTSFLRPGSPLGLDPYAKDGDYTRSPAAGASSLQADPGPAELEMPVLPNAPANRGKAR